MLDMIQEPAQCYRQIKWGDIKVLNCVNGVQGVMVWGLFTSLEDNFTALSPEERASSSDGALVFPAAVAPAVLARFGGGTSS